MTRYLRLYLHFIVFSLSKTFEFRLDFWFRTAMDLLFYIINIIFFKVLFIHTNLLGGWREDQVMIFVGTFLVIDALQMTLFSNSLWMIPETVNKGTFDYHLIRPVSTIFFLSLREIAFNSFINLIMALAILVYAFIGYSGSISVLQLLFYILFLINGLFLYYLVRFCLMCSVFWTHATRGVDSLFFALSHLMERPDTIFHGWIRKIFVTIVPFSIMASFPCRLLFDGLTWSIILHMVAVTAMFVFILRYVWSKALIAYSSASS